MLARYDPIGERTAVVTTVGVSLHSDDGTVGGIGGDLTERSGRVAMSADGRLLAIAGETSGIVTAFDLTTGQAVGLPFTADQPVARLAFVPDGSALVVSTSGFVTRVPVDERAVSAGRFGGGSAWSGRDRTRRLVDRRARRQRRRSTHRAVAPGGGLDHRPSPSRAV